MIFLRLYRWLWILVPVILYIMWCKEAIKDLIYIIKNITPTRRFKYFLNGDNIEALQAWVGIHISLIFLISLVYFIMSIE